MPAPERGLSPGGFSSPDSLGAGDEAFFLKERTCLVERRKGLTLPGELGLICPGLIPPVRKVTAVSGDLAYQTLGLLARSGRTKDHSITGARESTRAHLNDCATLPPHSTGLRHPHPQRSLASRDGLPYLKLSGPSQDGNFTPVHKSPHQTGT